MVGTIIQGLIITNNDDYIPQAWHGTLLTIAVISFAIFFNTFLAGKLPLTEGVAVIVHICGLFCVIVPLWVMSPRGDSREVLLEFTNLGNWPSNGLSAMIGLITPVSIWIGYECSVHMAEEIHDASRNLPKSILSAVSLNCGLGFLMAMTLIFCVGDTEAALAEADDYNGYAFLGIFMNTVRNRHAVNMMVFLIVFGLTNCAISETAVTSRQIWSFARDSGLPFSGWLSHISPDQNIPLRAVLVSFSITALLSEVSYQYWLQRRAKRHQLSCRILRALELLDLDRLPRLAPYIRCSSPSAAMVAWASRSTYQHSCSMRCSSSLVLRVVSPL